MKKLLESHKMTSICPRHTNTVFHSKMPIFHGFTPRRSRCARRSMVWHHSFIRKFFFFFRGSENNGLSYNRWHLRVHEMWDINTEIQDINSERGLQGEAGNQNLKWKIPFSN